MKKSHLYFVLLILTFMLNGKTLKAQVDSLGFAMWVEQPSVSAASINQELKTYYSGISNFATCNPANIKVNKLIVRFLDRNYNYPNGNPFNASLTSPFYTEIIAKVPQGVDVYILPWIKDWPNVHGKSKIYDMLLCIKEWNALINDPTRQIKGIVMEGEGAGALIDNGPYCDYKNNLVSGMYSPQQAANSHLASLGLQYLKIGVTVAGNNLGDPPVWGTASGTCYLNRVDETYLQVYNMYSTGAAGTNPIYVDAFDTQKDGTCLIPAGTGVPVEPTCISSIYLEAIKYADPVDRLYATNPNPKHTFNYLLSNPHFNWKAYTIPKGGSKYIFPMLSIETNHSYDDVNKPATCIFPNTNDPTKCGQINAFGSWKACDFVDFVDKLSNNIQNLTKFADPAERIPKKNFGIFQYALLPKSWVYYTPPTFKTVGPVKVCDKASIDVNIVECMYYQLWDTQAKKYYGNVGGITRSAANSTTNYNNYNKIADAGVYTIDNVDAGTYTIRVFSNPLKKETCFSESAATITVIKNGPTVSIAASPGKNICVGNAVTLTATSPTGVSYSWSPAITNGVAFTPLTSGLYTVTSKDPQNCTSTDTITITLNTIAAGKDTTICAPTYTLNATLPAAATGLWTVKSGTGTFADNTNMNTVVSGLSSGKNEFTWTIQTGGCTGASKTVAITKNGSQTTPNAGEGISICSGATANFNGSALALGETGQWTIAPNAGTITDNTKAITTVTGLAIGTYIAKWTVTGSCATAEDTLTIKVNALPTATISGTTSICPGGNADLSFAFTGTQPWNFSYSDGTTTKAIAGITTSPYTLNDSPVGTKTFSLTSFSDSKCTGTTSGSATVTISPLPTAAIATTEAALGYCQGGSGVTLTATDLGVGAQYEWIKNGVRQGAATTSTTHANATLGSWKVKVTVGTCSDSSAAVAVMINPIPDVALTVTPDSVICLGDKVTLKGSSTLTGTTFSWNNGVADGVQFDVDNVSKFKTYTVTATSPANCIATQSVTLLQKVGTTISTNPIGFNACVGDSKTLSVLANGDGVLTYEWFKDNISKGNNSNTLSFNNLTLAEAGTYKVKVTGGCGIFTSTDAIVSINDKPVITSQPIKSGGCVGSVAGLSVVATSGSTLTYQWLKLPATNVGTNNPNISFNPLAQADTGVYKVDITNSCGKVTSDTASIVMPLDEVPTVDLMADKSAVCEGNSITLTAVIKQGGGSNPKFTFKDGKGTVLGTALQSSNTITTSNLNASQSYTVEMLSNSTCLLAGAPNPVLSKVVNVKVDSIPLNVSAGIDQSICTATFTLAGSDPKPGVGVWTVKSGAGSFSNSGLYNSNVSNIGADSNEYTWTVTNGVCASVSKTVTINHKSTMVPPDAGVDQNVCFGNTIHLNATALALGETGIWSITPNTATITSNSNPITTITNAAAGVYKVKWSISNGVCANVSDSLTVTITDKPAAPIAILGDTVGCQGQTVIENIALVAGATSYAWTITGATGFSTTNSIQGILGTGNKATFSVAAVNGCGSSDTISKEVTIKAVPNAPVFSTTIVGNNPVSICANSTAVYSVDTVKGETYTWSWKNGANQTNTAIYNGSISTLVTNVSTTITDTLTVSASNTCGVGSSKKIGVTLNPLPTFTIPKDTMVCQGNPLPDLKYLLTGKANYTINYTLDATPLTATATSNQFTISAAAVGKYQIVSVTDANGCTNNTASAQSVVSQILSPKVDYTLSAGVTCGGSTVILTQSGSELGVQYMVYKKEGLVRTLLTNYTGDGKAMSTSLVTSSLNTGQTMIEVDAIGCSSNTFTDTATVTVLGKLGAITGKSIICNNDNKNVSYSITPFPGVSVYKWTLSNPDGAVVGSDSGSTVAVNFGNAASYTLTVVAKVGGQVCLASSNNLTILQKSAYQGDTLKVSQDTICADEYITLSIPSKTATSYQHWTFPLGAVSTADSLSFLLKPTQSGTISVQPTDACQTVIAPLTKNIVVYKTPLADAGTDFNLQGYPVNLVLSGQNVSAESGVQYHYNWMVSKGTADIIGATTLTPMVNPKVVETRYVLTVSTPDQKCVSSDSVNVRFEIQISPPLIFSPNGDSKNDYWNITGLEYFPNATVEIFNQWGLKIYSKTGEYTAEPWDGGNEPIATYYYTIVPNVPGLEAKVGSVTIVR